MSLITNPSFELNIYQLHKILDLNKESSMSNHIMYSNTPKFTGRHVPIEEISRATGRSCSFLREGLKMGFLKFGYACKKESAQVYSFYCPDKLVWEELGYFNENPTGDSEL